MTDTHALQREIENARIVREQIIAAAGDDPDFIRDGIEGETSVLEMVDRMVNDDGEDEALIEAIKAYEEKVKARRKRIENRVSMRRAILGTALEIAELKKRETPSGTISLRPVPPALIVQEEADIPVQFWKPQAPALDKKALLDFLKNGNKVAGATLSNGSITTTIRR